MTIFDTRQMSSNEYNITHIIQVSSTNNHSFHSLYSVHSYIKLYTFETFWTLHDPMTALTIAFSYHVTFSLTWFVLGLVSLWQSFPFIIHILSQTNTKSFEQSLLLMRASVLKAVYYCVSVWLALDCMTLSVILLEMMSLPLYFEDWPSILADPHCSG